MAADPHQRVGNRRDVNSSESDRFRDWDGFRDFHRAVQTIQNDSAATGLDYSVLEGGLARLGAISVEMDQEASRLKLRRDIFAKQSAIFSGITTAGDLLEGDLNAQARRLIPLLILHLVKIVVHGVEIEVDPVKKEMRCLGRIVAIPDLDNNVKLRILVDRGVIDVFCNGGLSNISHAGDIFS